MLISLWRSEKSYHGIGHKPVKLRTPQSRQTRQLSASPGKQRDKPKQHSWRALTHIYAGVDPTGPSGSKQLKREESKTAGGAKLSQLMQPESRQLTCYFTLGGFTPSGNAGACVHASELTCLDAKARVVGDRWWRVAAWSLAMIRGWGRQRWEGNFEETHRELGSFFSGWHIFSHGSYLSTLDKNRNATLLFSSAELKDLRLFQKASFLSNIVHRSALMSTSPSSSPGCWLDRRIIERACLHLPTIKGHSEMCSFTLLGVRRCQKTSQYLA